jgi:hypothetical protein
MRLEPFKLERYFAKHKFSAPYLLCSSDCESMELRDLLALEPNATKQFSSLWLSAARMCPKPSRGLRNICGKPDIGIGRSLAAPPSHTTQHTGPYCAIRLIRQVQLQGNESPSDVKWLSGKAILTHFTLLIRQGPLRAQPVVTA